MESTSTAGQGSFVPQNSAEPQSQALAASSPVAACHRVFTTVLGEMVVAVGDFDGHPALTGVWFKDQKHFPDAETLGHDDDGANSLLQQAQEQILEWLAGDRQEFDLPLALGSKPQGLRPRVWQALLQIPHGTTTTYGELAAQMGGKGMAQAVGQAVGRNPWSIVVPCHRVVSSTGALTGYAGGLERKRWLLTAEGSLPQEPELF
ncbi:methylated-DNA--[protein]-cysteine S-methyltransferase [Kocuria sp. ZOR0020]|uniref:methylated-DNA--[protein]-cysteine S-methyltransferase n=1 Tax=Kocuria sp. ZOR0020 TaxID=1339234 RepID=UPI000B0A65C0|nr:methylated-DNA--[protein]-cysteine S-methyltransferase [Kocuria sp. ZOR0020]